MVFVILASLVLRGFWARISILLGLVFGYLLSALLDATAGPITSVLGGATEATTHDRLRPVRRRGGALGRPAGLHRAALLASTSACWCCPRSSR